MRNPYPFREGQPLGSHGASRTAQAAAGAITGIILAFVLVYAAARQAGAL